jgi:Phospholipase_D-nuclease N-terminal
MLDVGGLLFVGLMLFWVWAIYDVATTDPSRVRNLPKIMWVVVVVLLFPLLFDLGPILWVLLGRPPRVAASSNHPQAQRRPRRAPEPPPDADLHGQRVVTDRRSAELDRMLEEWERARRDEGASEA